MPKEMLVKKTWWEYARSLAVMTLLLPCVTHAQFILNKGGQTWSIDDNSGSLEIQETGESKGFTLDKLTGNIFFEGQGIQITGTDDPGTDITSPGDGTIAYASGNDTLQYYNGTQWITLTGVDNLGDHEATQNIDLNTFKLVGNDGSLGLSVDASGNVDLDEKLEMGGEQTIYHAQAEDSFTGSFFVGNGGGSLNHTSGSEAYYNTAVGIDALNVNTAGAYNTAVGTYALDANTTGSNNLAIGPHANGSNTIGGENIAVGVNALASNSTQSYNTAVGSSALRNSTSTSNTAVGRYTMRFQTTGAHNVGLGMFAGYNNQTGSFNVSIGNYTASQNTTATGTVAIGYAAAGGNGSSYTGTGYTIVGYQAADSPSTGADYNTLFGYQSAKGLTSGARNVLIGPSTIADSYDQVTTGSRNIAIGNDVALASATANDQLVIGNLIYGTSLDGTGSTVSSGNIGIGVTAPAERLDIDGKIAVNGAQTIYHSGAEDGFTGGIFVGDGGGSLSHTSGNDGRYNTAVGVDALYDNTTGNFNAALGASALANNTTGIYNVAVGGNALYTNTTGTSNTAQGTSALYYNLTGGDNTAQGSSALFYNTGSQNTAQGKEALYSNTSGGHNTASGRRSMYTSTTGSHNTAHGSSALGGNTTGSNNVALGSSAGHYITDGTTPNQTAANSVFIGASTKALASNNTNQIVIGYSATGVGDNSVVLGNDSITKTILKGNIGIGTTAPDEKLEVDGNVLITNTNDICIDDTTAGWGDGSEVCLSSAGSWDHEATQNIDLNTFKLVGNDGSDGISIDSSGNVTVDGTVSASSDRRLKENIQPLHGALEKILQITGVNFEWKKKLSRNSRTQIGVIAQEVKKVYPELVDKNESGLTVNYGGLTASLIEAMRELNAQVQELKTENSQLKSFLCIEHPTATICP